MRWLLRFWLAAGVATGAVNVPLRAERILFVGNSFTFGAGSAVRFFHPELVHDLNRERQGGVPALFKMFTQEAGLSWDVSLETAPGQDFAWHLATRRAEMAGQWDVVVLQDYSTLDKLKPGDATIHVRDAAALALLFRSGNPTVRLLLETTWPRADLIYPTTGHWYGRTVKAMVDDLAHANALASGTGRSALAVAPVGEAWLRAMEDGLADPNPYDGVALGKLNLWTWDHYHASAYGYYLAALVIFGRATGYDPRSLGARERAAEELGFDPATAVALQRIAAETLAAAPEPRTGVTPRETPGGAGPTLSRPR